MYILAFETSCDDTSVALMKDSACIALSTRTQMEHDETGWVVPEVAARSHANAIFPCIEDVLRQSGVSLDEIDYFACTKQPWLMPSLLTGLTVSQMLAEKYDKPFLPIDHIEWHIFANFLEREFSDIVFPNLTLTVSGGHTEIYLWKSLFDMELVSQTRDDAAGECFDKVAKMLWLGFPGWAKIARLSDEFAQSASEEEKSRAEKLFPRGLSQKSLEFSFSGMKSAVKRYIDEIWILTEHDIKKVAYAAETAILDVLVTKLLVAAEEKNIKNLYLAGWVSANTRLKNILTEESEKRGYSFAAPKKILYSMDNAAMIGIRAYYEVTQRTL